MRIYLFTAKGDELLIETDVVEEAEKIIREYLGKGASEILTAAGDVIALPLKTPLADEAFMLWPMAGG